MAELQDLASFDVEEVEVRGKLTFKPPVEVLPKTKRTEELQKRKIEDLKKKKEAAENLRREKEKEEALRRQKEQRMKREKAQQEQQRKEQEKRRREEEEQRKKMEGGLDQIMSAMYSNTTAANITTCSIDLDSKPGQGSVRLRVMAGAMADNTSCLSLDLSRKGMTDEDGVSLAEMLEKNQHLQKLECEGNNLGVRSAEAIGEALRKNKSLRCLNLESNNLAASGNDQRGIIKLAEALQENRTLRVLMLSKNGITAQAGEYFVKAIEGNDVLTMVDLSGNDPSPSVEQLRRIDAAVQRNRDRQSAIRRAERRERFALYNEEFLCRQFCMQVEARRLEIEAHEERRMNRMKARFEKWVDEVQEAGADEKLKQEELVTEAMDRAEANKSKKKNKRKG